MCTRRLLSPRLPTVSLATVESKMSRLAVCLLLLASGAMAAPRPAALEASLGVSAPSGGAASVSSGGDGGGVPLVDYSGDSISRSSARSREPSRLLQGDQCAPQRAKYLSGAPVGVSDGGRRPAIRRQALAHHLSPSPCLPSLRAELGQQKEEEEAGSDRHEL